MEKTTPLETWEDFKDEVDRLKNGSAEAGRVGSLSRSDLLFRGQSDSDWTLLTTLERYYNKSCSFMDYSRLVLLAKPEIETFTGQQWDYPKFSEMIEWCKEYERFRVGGIFAYEYLVYLRHHGFPSPLLDWSASPYVAAFFAFENAKKAGNVAIYCYQEYAGAGKTSSSDEPQIKSLGPHVRSHARHFLQQSQYTICGRFQSGSWSFTPHEDVFNLGTPQQDILTKFILPASERRKVLWELNEYNLNAFSLFQNEEALLRTISFREFERSDRRAG